jgi:hypothetical protein
MYVAFYVWHGLFLNDLNRISFPLVIFLGLAALVYLVISFVLYKTYESKLLAKYVSPPVLRGIVSGAIVGFVLFATVAVLGISFANHVNATYLLADCAWQIVEQIIGGIIIGLGKVIIFEPIPELIHRD